MKNKFIVIFFLILLSSTLSKSIMAEEFIFEVNTLEITDNGNIYKAKTRGKIKANTQLELISDNFEYYKKTNQLKTSGNVQLYDFTNNITIDAETIFYFKDIEKIFTKGKTLIKISDKYTIEGYDLTLLKNEMILSSNKNTIITDKNSNKYKLKNFQYSINQEILKGENIEVLMKTNEKNNNDNFFIKTGFFNLKDNKFLAKDISATLRKDLFGNNENDPRIVAVSAKGDGPVTFFEKGVFTSCKKTDKCPPWKISAERIEHNKTKQQIIYKNAWLEVYDFPVFYFPKFFHPDPNVKRQSGFLTPGLGSSQNSGSSIFIPYFYVISDDKDITVKPKLFDNNKFLLQNEFRQKTKKSLSILDFGFVKGHDSNNNDKGDTRSHIFTSSMVDLSLDNYLNSILKVNYQKTTNDNYLKKFDLESPILPVSNDVLESIIELELEHEDYDLTTSFEMYETLEGSNNDRYQYILPSYNFSKNFFLESVMGSFNLNSHGNNTLKETNVTTSKIFNDLNYSSINNFLDNGIKTNFDIFLKNVNTTGKNDIEYKDKLHSRLMSAYTFNASLPMINKTFSTFNTLEPKLSLRLSPHQMRNNSTLERRIDMNNIFNSNRLSMDESFESGESITLGLNFKKEKVNIINELSEIEEYIDFKLASVFRLNEEKNIPNNSTLNKKTSNIFGEFNFKPIKNISLGYNFSLTEDLDTFEYNSLVTKMKYENFTTQFDYLKESGVIGRGHIIENKTKYSFNNSNSISFNIRENRELNLTEYYDLIYEYKNDCLVAGVKYKKNYYNDGDIEPIEELFFSITIVPLTTLTPSKMALN
ncbi:organic solvent tolerance protein [Candidatus Pelagibacter sp.]|nr:organic solvent tolerance protein [Candidatus Pelagibacter sp.]